MFQIIESEFVFPKINFGLKYKFNDSKSLEKIVKKNGKNIFGILIEPFSASTYKHNSIEFLKLAKNFVKNMILN